MSSLFSRTRLDDVFIRPWLMWLLMPFIFALGMVSAVLGYAWRFRKAVAVGLLAALLLFLGVGLASAADYNVSAVDGYSGASLNDIDVLVSPSYSLTGSLAAYYRLSNEDNTSAGGVVDLRAGLNGTASGYTVNDGTVSGGVTINETSDVMVFDGSTGYAQGSALSISTNVTTVVAKIKPSAITTGFIANQYDSTVADRGILLFQQNSDIRFYGSTGNYNELVGVVDTEEFITVAFVVNGNIKRAYLEGVFVSEQTNGAGVPDSPELFTLGASPSGTSHWGGELAFIRIWNKQLTDAQIAAETNSTYALEGDGLVAQYSGRDFTGSAASPTTILDKNMVVSTGVANVPTAWYFDSDNSNYVSAPSFPDLSSATFGGWVYVEDASDTGVIMLENPVNARWSILFSGNTLYLRGGGLTNQVSYATGGDLDGGWTHIIGVINGTTGTIYINGTSVSSGTITAIANGTGLVNIGRYESSGYFNGSLAGMFLADTAFTSDEVLALYNSGAGREYPFSASSETLSTSSGNVSLFVPVGYGITQNLTINASDGGGYFPRTYTAYSFESSGDLEANLTQSTATFTAEDVLGNAVTDFNVTIDGTTRTSSETWNLSAGTYNATFSKDGWYNLTQEVTTSPLTNHAFTIEDVYNHILQLSVNDLSGVGDPNVFSVNVTNSDYPSWYEFVSVDANTTETNSSFATTAYTTSATYVTLATIEPLNEYSVLEHLFASLGHASSTCESRVTVNYVDGTNTTIITAHGSTGSAGTQGFTLTGYNSTLPFSSITFEERITSGGSGCRVVDSTYATQREAPSAFLNLVHGDYVVELLPDGWVNNNYSVYLINSSNFTFYEMDVYVASTVLFEFRNIDDLSLIDDRQVNVSMVGSTITYDFSTSNGTLVAAPVNADTYTVTASAENFTSNSVFVTTADDNQSVTMYLSPSSVEILFIVRDTLGNDVSEATLTFLRNVNGSEVVFTQAETDFSGTASIDLDVGVSYSFTVTHPSYSTFSDVVTPIAALSPYVVRMRPLAEEVFTTALDDVLYVIRQEIDLNKTWFYVEFETTSASGVLQWFSISSEYDSVSYSMNASGSPGGGIVSINVTNLNVSNDNVVPVTFGFKSTGFDSIVWSQNFRLSPYSPGDYTLKKVFEAAASELGLVGKAILATFVVIIALAVGVGVTGNLSVGSLIGIVAVGVMTWTGLYTNTYGLLAVVFLSILVVADNLYGRSG